MGQINFTKEHRDKLMALAGDALVSGTTFKGSVGSEMNIYDLFHNTQIASLSRIHGNIKKEVSEIESLDDWSLTEYQQRKAARLKSTQELISLIIGFKRKAEEDAANKSTAKDLKTQIETLKRSVMTPEAQIAELEARLAGLGPVEAV